MTHPAYLEKSSLGGILTVTLNRPEVHNAFNDGMVHELTSTFRELARDPEIRVVVLTGSGPSFSAGADLQWMRSMVNYGFEENVADAKALAEMFLTIDRSPKPVVARIHGAAIGGGAGLVSVADIAIATTDTRFAFAEVRLGIIPAVISPFVLARIGPGAARRYFLTGERFDGEEARAMGLIAEAVEADALDTTVHRVTQAILRCGPEAVTAAKALIQDHSPTKKLESVIDETARRIAERRASDEGQAGMLAFLEKKNPPWISE